MFHLLYFDRNVTGNCEKHIMTQQLSYLMHQESGFSSAALANLRDIVNSKAYKNTE